MLNGINKMAVKESGNLQFGFVGFEQISDTSAHTGYFYAIKAINGNAVVATGVSALGDNPTSISILEGDYLYGDFTSFTLASGEVLAYKYKV